MRVLVMGTGAMGGYYGGRLALAGNDVVFVARGKNLVTLRQQGLQVRSFDGDFTVPHLRVTSDPKDAGLCEVVLVCVKAYDTPAAGAAMRPAIGPDTIVLSLQNGVESEEILRQILGLPALMGALAQIGAELFAPGVVQHVSGGRIVFGEFDGTRSERACKLEELFDAAGIQQHVSERIAVRLWEKLAWNAAFNALTAIMRCTVGALLTHPDGWTLVRQTMNEVSDVAHSIGVQVDASQIEPTIDRSLRELSAVRTSMMQDVEQRKRLEHDAINGAVIRAAARSGVPVPVNRTLHALLASISNE